MAALAVLLETPPLIMSHSPTRGSKAERMYFFPTLGFFGEIFIVDRLDLHGSRYATANGLTREAPE